MEKVQEEQLEIVLREMCSRVGADYDEVDFKKKDWYRDHSWTEDQESDFRDWLMSHMRRSAVARNALMSVPEAYAGVLKRFADMFLLSYGWRVED